MSILTRVVIPLHLRFLCWGYFPDVIASLLDCLKPHVCRIPGLTDRFIFRAHSKDILIEFKELGRAPPTFNDCSVIAEQLLKSGFEFDQGKVFYNYFK